MGQKRQEVQGLREEEQETFTVGLEAGYPPFNWTQMDDSNGGVKIDGNAEYAGGYDVEIAKKIAEGLGKELVIVKTEWDGLVHHYNPVKSMQLLRVCHRQKSVNNTIDFSDNYYTSNFVMVVKKGGAYEGATSIQDFRGAKITGTVKYLSLWGY